MLVLSLRVSSCWSRWEMTRSTSSTGTLHGEQADNVKACHDICLFKGDLVDMIHKVCWVPHERDSCPPVVKGSWPATLPTGVSGNLWLPRLAGGAGHRFVGGKRIDVQVSGVSCQWCGLFVHTPSGQWILLLQLCLSGSVSLPCRHYPSGGSPFWPHSPPGPGQLLHYLCQLVGWRCSCPLVGSSLLGVVPCLGCSWGVWSCSGWSSPLVWVTAFLHVPHGHW